MSDLAPTEAMLHARLDGLRQRVEVLREPSDDAGLMARCEAELISLEHLRTLVPEADASTLRALLAMVDAKSDLIQTVEDSLAAAVLG